MFKDKDIKMIWCAKGGNNSNITFEYIDFEAIKNNPKITINNLKRLFSKEKLYFIF